MKLSQIKAIEKVNKLRILKVCPEANESSGIYVFTRYNEVLNRAYIGQAKNLLNRLAGHLRGYEHIDLSIKKRGFANENNINGWYLTIINKPEEELDSSEQYFIKWYGNNGFQLYNKNSGGKGVGKVGIGENKPSKGYQQGVAKGYLNAQKYIAKLFDKNLVCSINGATNKNKEKAMEKFNDFIKIEVEVVK